ncbi:MAG: hypothetical protein JWO77_2361 [Ilumatobacteraceae bacterium]|nr:hypothetical protein [Ilumatobacteraceae bacterium]
MLSTPSAEPGADDAFRSRRVARLRARRGRLHWSAWAAIAAVTLVAVAVTVDHSQPKDTVRAEALNPKVKDAAAPRQGGTGCVGWPLDLTPTAKPSPRTGAVSLWGDRDAFHFRNVGAAEVVIDVTSTDGALRPVESDAVQVGEDHLRFELGPDSEARFTAACGVTTLMFTGTSAGAPLGAAAFQMGSGPADAPLEIAKVVR